MPRRRSSPPCGYGRSPAPIRRGRAAASVGRWSSWRRLPPAMRAQPPLEIGGAHRDDLKVHLVVVEAAELRAARRGAHTWVEDQVEGGRAVREGVALEP